MPRGKLYNLQIKKATFIKKLMEDFIRMGGGKKEGFSLFFPSKIRSFSPQIMELRKIAGAGTGKVHHIYRTTQHLSLCTSGVLPPLCHSINVPIT